MISLSGHPEEPRLQCSGRGRGLVARRGEDLFLVFQILSKELGRGGVVEYHRHRLSVSGVNLLSTTYKGIRFR